MLDLLRSALEDNDGQSPRANLNSVKEDIKPKHLVFWLPPFNVEGANETHFSMGGESPSNGHPLHSAARIYAQ